MSRSTVKEMNPRYNEEKATQIACYIIKKRGGKINILKLMKLMYLIDRETLLRWGWSLTGDAYVSMPKGMVLSRTYNLVNEESLPTSYWKTYVSAPTRYDVTLIADPEVDELSDAEIGLIDELYEKFGHLNRWVLVDEVHHKLPEWVDPNGSSLGVEYRAVLEESGKSEQEIFETLSELEGLALLEKLVV